MTTSLWDELLAAALLGTARKPFELPATTGPLSALLAGIDRSDPEGALLSAAAATALFQSAGQRPAFAVQPGLLPAPPDERPAASERAGHFLQQVLECQPPVRQQLAQEWLAALAATGRRVPPGSLSLLLDYAAAEPQLQPQVRDLIGERGRWLATLNPGWQFALKEDLPADPVELERRWAQSGRAERSECLRQLRAREPSRGLALLETTWRQERAADRAAFLAELATGLSMADEPFLEQSLDDRSKEVRARATDLLLQLPESQLRRRMIERTAALLEWQPARLMRRARITVTPPAELDAALIRDGIVANTQDGQGQRSWWLLQLIERIPLTEWCRRWNATPHELLTAEIAHEWRATVITGWERAALRYVDTEWVKPLLKRWLAQGSGRLSGPPAALLTVLPPAERETFVLEVLSKHSEPLHADHPALPLLDSCRHQWSIEFSRIVMEHLSRRLTQKGAQKHGWELQSMLDEASLRMAPEISGEALALADRIEKSLHWNKQYLGKLMRQLADLLAFRRDMLEELRHERDSTCPR